MALHIHPDIASLNPYVPGKPIEELQRELGLARVIKLASNENPLGPSPKALAALAGGHDSLHRYPDGGAYRLRQALADRWKVSLDHIILGNGSDEVLGLLARTFLAPGDEAVMADQTFVIYKMEVTAAHGKAVIVPLINWTHDLDGMAKAITPKTRLVFLCNPNNPTGTMVAADAVARFMAKVPEDVVVVFDEAYLEYVRDPHFPDSLQYVMQGAERDCAENIFKDLWVGRIKNRLWDYDSGDHQLPEPRAATVQRQHAGAARGAGRAGRRRPCGEESSGECGRDAANRKRLARAGICRDSQARRISSISTSSALAGRCSMPCCARA
jgi:hypothetical protein